MDPVERPKLLQKAEEELRGRDSALYKKVEVELRGRDSALYKEMKKSVEVQLRTAETAELQRISRNQG